MKILFKILFLVTVMAATSCSSGYHPGATGYHYSHKRSPVKKLYKAKRHLFEYQGHRGNPFW